MGEAGEPNPAEEAQPAFDATAVKVPKGCTGTVPTKPLKDLSKLTKEELEADIDVLRETIKARNARIKELDGIMKQHISENEGGKIMTEIRALDAQYIAELVCLDATLDCTCN